MAFCRVSYRDIEKIEHTVELDADTLYEAVAQAVHRFRTEERWAGVVPGPGCEFIVEVQPDRPRIYKLR